MKSETKIRQLHTDHSFEGHFEAIYKEFFKPLYLYARSIAKSDDIAKDVVSDVFFNLWKSQADLTHVKELGSYLFRSVKNQVVRALSHDPKSFHSVETEERVQQIERITPEDVLLEKELILIINEAIDHLPPQCRLIFDMAKNQQMSYAEISDALGISQSTIKTQVSRAIASIKRAIGTHYDYKSDRQPHYHVGAVVSLIFLLVG